MSAPDEIDETTENSEEIELTPEERVAEILDQFHSRLQEENLKSTRQRDTIVEVFFTIDEHISADELLSEVRREQPRIGYATVYRTLKLLVDLGFAITKDFGDGQTRYDPIHDQDPDHDHLICVKCRKIVEFNDQDTVQRFEQIADDYGFKLRRRQLELYAECKEPCEKPKK